MFRAAIENTDKSKLPITFRNFPTGSCGDVTPLLGAFLQEIHLGNFCYVLGSRVALLNGKTRQLSHAWLQDGKNLLVDITADQFEEINEKVIVTEDFCWHSSFNGKIQHIAHFNIYNKSTSNKLEHAYNEICKNI